MALAYAAGELAQNVSGVRTIVEKTLSALGTLSADIYATSEKGAVGRVRKFSFDLLATLLKDSTSGSLTISGRVEPRAEFEMRLYLRHNQSIAVKYQPPGALSFVVECGRDALEPRKASEAVSVFLRECAAEVPVLHGGIMAFPTRDQALSEASLIGIDISKEPRSFVERWTYDARNSRVLWQKARHVYWTTLLGPSLAKDAGGADAAVRAGAINVEDVNDSLIFAATADLEDSLSTDFLHATFRQRKWLWPYLIQNPQDAPE